MYLSLIVCVLFCVGDVDYVRRNEKSICLNSVYTLVLCVLYNQKTPSSSYCVLLLASAVECERIDYSKRCYIIFAVEGIFFILFYILSNKHKWRGREFEYKRVCTPTHINASADTKWGGKCWWGCENCVLYSFCCVFFCFCFFCICYAVQGELIRGREDGRLVVGRAMRLRTRNEWDGWVYGRKTIKTSKMWMASTKYINFLFAMCSMLWCCIKKEGKKYI